MKPLRPFTYAAAWTAVLLVAISGCSNKSDTTSSASSSPDSTLEESVTSEDDPSDAVDRSGQLLRHVVLFSFKEESSEEDVQGVVDAFAGLRNKIPSIVGFQWGTNNSPEGKDDGFTHCFVLSFNSEADRDEYIPHPAHAGEFADVLRPHMKSVFVIDYWGTPSDPKEEVEKTLQHLVFFRFKEDASEEDVQKVEEAFAALPGKIDEINGFEWGTNNSPEGKDDGFTHCFLVTFASEEARAAYLPHDEHQAFVQLLGPVLDKARVIDFWVN